MNTNTTSIFSDEILKQADEVRQADGRYETAFDNWAQSVPAVSPEYFWPEIQRLRLIWREKGDSDSAADEYLRQASVEGEERFAAAVHFCVSYRRYSEGLRSRCEHITLGWERGDDGFGDLMDSLPMAGSEVYSKVKSGEFFGTDADGDDTVNLGTLEGLVKMVVPGLDDSILHGENYWASTLEEKARERMKFVLCYRR